MTNLRSRIPKAASFLGGHKAELALFALGVSLRMTMAWSYRDNWGYDADQHWDVVAWIVQHGRVPPVESSFEAFHPPLYYAVAAGLFKLGVSRAHMVWLSIACGTARLALLWTGLELYLRSSRAARLAGLAIAAVLPVSVHVDGMIYGEPMSGMWVAFAMLLVPLAFRRPPDRRRRLAVGLGVILGLAMLTKISGVVIIFSIGIAALLELVLSGWDWRARGQDVLAWATMLGVCLALCGWYFARNVRDYGKPFVTTFDLPSEHRVVAQRQREPYLERRSLGYVFGWDAFIYEYPYQPTSIGRYPRFFPLAVASTFVDFWSYNFSGIPPKADTGLRAGFMPISREVLKASQYSVLGGTAIFVATLIAWLAVLPRLFRERDWGRFALLVMPAVMLAMAVHFAIQNPADNLGVVKGAYMQFAAPPLCALFGVAVDWSLQRALRWPVFALLIGALWLVACYTLYCRMRIAILPLGYPGCWL